MTLEDRLLLKLRNNIIFCNTSYAISNTLQKQLTPPVYYDTFNAVYKDCTKIAIPLYDHLIQYDFN